MDVLLHLVAQDLLGLDAVGQRLQPAVLLHEQQHLLVVFAGHLLTVHGELPASGPFVLEHLPLVVQFHRYDFLLDGEGLLGLDL